MNGVYGTVTFAQILRAICPPDYVRNLQSVIQGVASSKFGWH